MFYGPVVKIIIIRNNIFDGNQFISRAVSKNIMCLNRIPVVIIIVKIGFYTGIIVIFILKNFSPWIIIIIGRRRQNPYRMRSCAMIYPINLIGIRGKAANRRNIIIGWRKKRWYSINITWWTKEVIPISGGPKLTEICIKFSNKIASLTIKDNGGSVIASWHNNIVPIRYFCDKCLVTQAIIIVFRIVRFLCVEIFPL